jgi:stage II sporulation protein D
MSVYSKTPVIKVRIANSLKEVVVSGRDVDRYIWPKKSHKTFEGKKTIAFNCKSKIKRLKSGKPVKLASISSKTGLLNWNKNHYRGALHIQTSEKFDGCDLINELSLEDYLKTLLPKEMSSSWPIEALKAQAVAARSYAYYKIKFKQVSRSKGFNVNYDLENSEKHQVNGNFFDITKKTSDATDETNGEVLTLASNQLAPIFFHSKCGGKTLRPDQVWTNKVPGYVSVECPFCHKHGLKNWSKEFKKKELFSSFYKALKRYNKDKEAKASSRIELIDDHKSSSRVKFYCKDDFKTIRKSRLRSTMGRKKLPSNYFHIREKKNTVVVSGSGYGHGVGLCQFGAKELALKGFTYKQILAHYFPKFKLVKIYK